MKTDKTPATLRKEMVIDKARQGSWRITLKSAASFALIWGLWALTAYLVADDHHSLLNRPIIQSWTLADIGQAALLIVLAMLVVMQLWGMYVDFIHRQGSSRQTGYSK